MKKIFAGAVLSGMLAATVFGMSGCGTTIPDITTGVLTPANIQTGCGWIQDADMVFQVAAPLAKLPANVIANEKTADASAVTLCTPPYPTDLEALMTKILAVVAQIQGITPTASAS